jgi:ribonuclease HII
VPEHLDALDRLGPSIHHRSFFAPVAAARAKHMPWTVESERDLFSAADEVEVQVEVQVEVEDVDASASL